jgi:hypothetical protein
LSSQSSIFQILPYSQVLFISFWPSKQHSDIEPRDTSALYIDRLKFVCRQKRRRVIPRVWEPRLLHRRNRNVSGDCESFSYISWAEAVLHQICLYLLSHCIRSASVFLPLHPEMGTNVKSTNSLAFFVIRRLVYSPFIFYFLFFFIFLLIYIDWVPNPTTIFCILLSDFFFYLSLLNIKY